jgi:hypothetical protein
VRVSILTLNCALTSALVLAACKPDPEPIDSETESETGDPPSCLDSQAPGADIVLNTDADILELQLSDCVPETIIVTGGGITNLTNLSTLRHVGRLEIRFCPNLTVLTGLQDLTRVDTFIITGNQVLPTLPNFNELEQINALTITGNVGLTDLGKFSVPILSSLNLTGNSTLASYGGLETLTAVTGNVTLSGNSIVTDFTGLENLTSIGGNLTIEDNDDLASLAGLGVTSVNGDLTILTNPNLSVCLIEDFVLSVDIGGATVVSGNMSDLCD